MSEVISQIGAKGQAVAKYLDNLNDTKIEVPMLPDVASRVMAMSNDPDLVRIEPVLSKPSVSRFCVFSFSCRISPVALVICQPENMVKLGLVVNNIEYIIWRPSHLLE